MWCCLGRSCIPYYILLDSTVMRQRSQNLAYLTFVFPHPAKPIDQGLLLEWEQLYWSMFLHCAAALCCRAVLQGCAAGLCYRAVLQGCAAGLCYRSEEHTSELQSR